jgi:hypothetical protein
MALIEEALTKLPTRQREAFVMRYWEDMDVAETALAMGCSQGSVKTHCSRAVRALATKLEKHGTITKLTGALNSLKSNRNTAAHTFSKEGVTTTYDAPSVTRENFLEIYELLKLFEREIKQGDLILPAFTRIFTSCAWPSPGGL